MDVGGWLRRLGLEQYEAVFRDNKIDDTVLRNLTAEDLKELGVGFVGHRRKLLDAIAALRAEVSAPAPLSHAPPKTRKAAKDTAERRQVTVMFSDLVGSTSLSARMDPEDLREVISAYQTCVADTVRRFGGFVAKYMGDGVLIYFGYPQAHEDDAERAVRAGLEAIAAVRALKFSVPLQARVGIATGLVVVGDLIGSGVAQERGIIGETPNLAARLQAMADPNAVIVAESTRRLLGNLFELKDLGPREIKGIPGCIGAWAALRPSLAEGRFEALHAGGLTELIGRQEELELLLRRWSKAKTGQGQVVLLSGEPGIGKSRLSAAVMERLAFEPHTRLRYFCSPHHQDSALQPIIAQLERAARFEREDTPEAKLEKLAALLASVAPPPEDEALLAELLLLPTEGRFPPLSLAPQEKKEKTFEALLRQLQGLARQFPVLMIFEDAHWSDPSSREVFDHVVDRVRGLPILLVVTFRPEYAPPWVGLAHVTTLTLNRLDRAEGIALVRRIAGNKDLPDEIVDEIVERTDGVPLFVEELTKSALESAANDEGASFVARAPHPALAIPATLHASLMARLDRLGPWAKEIAQIGATIGRDFSYELLAAVADRRDAELHAALDQLADAGLVFRRGTPPQATYLFKHALLQDAAYATLLRKPRRDLHARVARGLAEWFPEKIEARPELLAHHCAEAGAIDEAAMYWGKAAQLAIRRSAMIEARNQLTRALSLLGTLAETPEWSRLELDLQVALGGTLIATRGWAAPETGFAFARALELCERLRDTSQLLPTLYGQYVFHLVRAELRASHEVAQRALDAAQSTHDAAALVIGHRSVGISLIHLGKLDAARAHLEQAIGHYDPDTHRDLAFRYAYDPLVACKGYLASLTLTQMGYLDQALRRIDEAIAYAETLSHRPSTAFALLHACYCHFFRRDEGLLRQRAAALIAECSKQGFAFWLAGGGIYAGWSKVEGGDIEAGLRQLRDGLAKWRAAEASLLMPMHLVVLAEACLRAGQANDALAAVTEALACVERSEERVFDAQVHRCYGDVLLAQSDRNAAEAEGSYRHALEIARGQNARLLELRAASSLARLWRDQGKHGKARDLLAPVYGWFTEGFDTLDLKQAESLLDELAE
ncbi:MULTISPECIES: adenylate/guanylate cyclase domain-containing protein [Bradyrhizobium]|uniref:adenylate/guanylate cyclase domain-containing protein n=1 Tax=Bradyrhizobium TaxID=374 RepID=UPI001AE5F742|nr:adenylate/guanylate cyclase domain-containing protein [Bradyrhizobium elkanii]MBP2433906.1 putative ATPase/class 3 adenylate cyclase [Bradyrhizobium elkanii]WLA89113.1 adenylate/guanylate cyclase domain-containing protein [Bradyrhizobium elkanii]